MSRKPASFRQHLLNHLGGVAIVALGVRGVQLLLELGKRFLEGFADLCDRVPVVVSGIGIVVDGKGSCGPAGCDHQAQQRQSHQQSQKMMTDVGELRGLRNHSCPPTA
jgi:hypothetical protein